MTSPAPAVGGQEGRTYCCYPDCTCPIDKSSYGPVGCLKGLPEKSLAPSPDSELPAEPMRYHLSGVLTCYVDGRLRDAIAHDSLRSDLSPPFVRALEYDRLRIFAESLAAQLREANQIIAALAPSSHP